MILGFLGSFRLLDVVDIAIVAAMVFAVLALLRETRSAPAMRGVLGMLVGGFLIYTLARTLGLVATAQVFERLWVVLAIGFIVAFEKDLRKALTDMGQARAFRRLFAGDGAGLDEVTKAVRSFSRQKIGALLCIERRDPLALYADTGTEIDGAVSSELLRTIFMAYSPLHDGAVVLRGDRIVAAGCILPLTSDQGLDKELGTRHRAAVGLSEETDAAVIVVSEETGTISLAVAGRLERHHTQETLKEALMKLLDVDGDATAASGV